MSALRRRMPSPVVDLGELERFRADLSRRRRCPAASAASEDNVRVRRAALESLGYSSRPEVTTLIDSAFHRADPACRRALWLPWDDLPDNRGDEEVLRSLVHVDDRSESRGPGGWGSRSICTDHFIKMLGEEEDDKSQRRYWSLSQIGGEDVRTISRPVGCS